MIVTANEGTRTRQAERPLAFVVVTHDRAETAAVHSVRSSRRPDIGVSPPRRSRSNRTLVQSVRREPSLQTAWAQALFGTRPDSSLLSGLGERY